MTATRDRLRVLTWHVHGNYLYYLSQVPHDFYVPVRPGRPEGYGGRAGTLPWPDNLHEVDAEEVSSLDLDCVLFQSQRNYAIDQHEILSESQRRLPRIFLEHDPPRQSPTDTRHPVNDPNVLLVHVTHFNDLMWDPGRTPTTVIEHGVEVPGHLTWTGDRPRGVAVVNNIASRGRRLGADFYLEAARQVDLDLIGMGSEAYCGLGELPRDRLLEAETDYRFFFNPIRYTSMGLSVCEAMMLGLPIVGLATTAMVDVIEDGFSGYLSTDRGRLIECMRSLIEDPAQARRLGEGARKTALERFSMERFIRDWERVLGEVTETRLPGSGRAQPRPASSHGSGGING